MNDIETKQSIIAITGMHRSGTSLAAALLQSAGVDVGKRLLGADETNANGHFENLDFLEFHRMVLRSQGIDDSGWTLTEKIDVDDYYVEKAKEIFLENFHSPIVGWKDPRTTLFLNFWANLLPDANFLLIYRSPWEVADSLYRRGGQYDNIFLTHPDLAVKLWIHYNQKILEFYDCFSERCILTSIYNLHSNTKLLFEQINIKFKVALFTPALDIYNRALLHTQGANAHRSTLIAHYFPQVLEIYQELNARAVLTDEDPNQSWLKQVNSSPYRVWAFQDWVNLRNQERKSKNQRVELERSQSQLQHTQAELERSQSQLQETFQNAQAERDQFQSQLQHIQAELEQTKAELQQDRTMIAAMETSKFWKLRTQWFKIKAKVKTLMDWMTNASTFAREQSQLQLQQSSGRESQSFMPDEGSLALSEINCELQQSSDRESQSFVPDEGLLALSEINCEDFWKILDPVIQEQLDRLKHSTPRISILTPTFNSSLDWFIETALSVLNQSKADWEWCIVDDGSTTNEIRTVLTDLAHKHPRIKVLLQESGGISSATNKALEMANGDYICFLDHDDTLAPTALQDSFDKLCEGFDITYSDEDKIDSSGLRYIEPFFKPDWSLEYFRGVMYVGHLLCVSKNLAVAVGGLRSEYDGVQDYEFMLRLSEITQNIGHIPKILYHWRKVIGSLAGDIDAKPAIDKLQQTAVNMHLKRLSLPATAEQIGNHRLSIIPSSKTQNPLISIIIPTKDAPDYLERCLTSIFSLSTYPKFEVLLVDNETTDPKALQVMREFSVKRLHFPNPFNYSRANNLGAKYAQGEYLVFLNNDTEVLTEDWLQYLLYYGEQPDVGAVGALLLFPDRTVQHAGVLLGIRGTADHLMRGFPSNVDGYAGSLVCAREVSSVTAACMMLKKIDFNKVGGFNEYFFTHYQDVDLCMKLIKDGKRNIFTPRATLIHYESVTRNDYYDMIDRQLLLDKWYKYIDGGDSFYNQNFDNMCYDYTVKLQ